MIKRLFAVLIPLFLLASSASFAGGPRNTGFVSSADVLAPFECPDEPPCVVVGTSTLIRSAAGVGLNIATTGLTPDVPHTVWAVVFNNRNACDAFPHDACGLGDLGNPAVNASLLWMTGNYSDSDGSGFFQGFLAVGDTDRQQPAGLPGDADGLVNPNRAEIHFIIREHPAPADSGENYEALNMLNGACPGGTDCTDVQFSVHLR